MDALLSAGTSEEQITIRSQPDLEYRVIIFFRNVGNSLLVDIAWCSRKTESSAIPL